mmetsp:Transcript_15181/g.23432  ORF Transcript_15181/g.23432 Transcript_15181/m.23432 type:complete len:175 (-) Transcript_15181:739-1263(-)
MDKGGPLNSHLVRMQKKEERKKDIIKAYTCKKAVYENCKMLAPDGVCLSNCDRKKAQWYVDKGLATVTVEEPFTITLNFEPSNRQFNRENGEEDKDDEFYVVNRENKCVRCGVAKDYSRFFIIPSLYRTHLPDELKSHRSHDIVLMCFACHEECQRIQDILKEELSEKFGVPLT